MTEHSASAKKSGTSLSLHLIRKRKDQYRLRRRRYLASLPQEENEPPETSDTAAPSQFSDLQKELNQLRHRLQFAQSVAQAVQKERDELRTGKEDLQRELEESKLTITQREEKFEAAQKIVENAKAQVQRTRADMEQQRRRFNRESEDVRRTAEEKLMRELFTVCDHFTIALESAKDTDSPEALNRGMTLIHRELMSVLEQSGLSQMKPLHEIFDPNLHEAASTVQDEKLENGLVAMVLRPGYLLRGKVLRPAMVIVNKIPGASTPLPVQSKEEDVPVQEEPLPSETNETEEVPPPGGTMGASTPLDHARRMLDSRDDEC